MQIEKCQSLIFDSGTTTTAVRLLLMVGLASQADRGAEVYELSMGASLICSRRAIRSIGRALEAPRRVRQPSSRPTPETDDDDDDGVNVC